MLHADDKSVLSVLAHSRNKDNELEAYVSDNPADLRSAMGIDDGIYLERNTSTSTKLSMLRKFFKAYGVNPEDLIFYLKDPKEEKLDEAGTRFEIRRKYWAFALEYIHNAHGDNGSFGNVNPSKENWISGFFGIGGFQITCVANYDQAQTYLNLSKSNKEKNKSAFDYLYARKAEIEAQMGTPLEWQRSEKTKASYVVCRLTDVSILNETDWIQMAKFHAEWSKKIYDVMVPYLQEWSRG